MERSPANRHPSLRTAAIVCLGTFMFTYGLSITALEDQQDPFCTAEGLIGPGGQLHGRDPSQDCKFVDENGDVLPGY